MGNCGTCKYWGRWDKRGSSGSCFDWTHPPYVNRNKNTAKDYYDAGCEFWTEEQSSTANSNSGANSKSGCYVATCIYGSYNCPEVWTLRRYRDNILSASWFGRQFIGIYYTVSPKVVELFGNYKWFNRFWKPILNRFIRKLQKSEKPDKSA